MATKVIIDTGPLVAFLNSTDTMHGWSVDQFSELTPPFLTCESVLSEVCFLLRRFHQGTEALFQLLERELIQLRFNMESETTAVQQLMKKYSDLPMSLADACLVRMSEQISDSVVCTLDTDFKIYRKEQRKVIPVIMPMARINKQLVTSSYIL